MANAPNLMILNDHEIREGFGWRKEDYTPETDRFDYFYGRLCR